MKNNHWEDELRDALKGMKPIIPTVDMRDKVMQEIRRSAPQQAQILRPLLSATARRAIVIVIPLLLIAAFLLSKDAPIPTESIFGIKPIGLPSFDFPDLSLHLSDTLRQALTAVFLFAFVQVILIGRLLRKADR